MKAERDIGKAEEHEKGRDHKKQNDSQDAVHEAGPGAEGAEQKQYCNIAETDQIHVGAQAPHLSDDPHDLLSARHLGHGKR